MADIPEIPEIPEMADFLGGRCFFRCFRGSRGFVILFFNLAVDRTRRVVFLLCGDFFLDVLGVLGASLSRFFQSCD